ncbi:MAG: hypothetical protein ABJJ37_05625 [Roseibium sp.]
MPVTRFPEQLGTLGHDTFTVSSFQETYGLTGNDTFNANNYVYATVVYGGLGDDTYNIGYNSNVVIMDTGGYDVYRAPYVSTLSPSVYTFIIDNSHLGIIDVSTGFFSAVANWFDASNRIEAFDLADGYFSYDQINIAALQSPNFRGYFSVEEVARDILWNPDATTQEVRDLFLSVLQREEDVTNFLFASGLPDVVSTQGASLVRFYNSDLEAFFYTSNSTEAAIVRQFMPSFSEHGAVFNVLPSGDTSETAATSIYRFLNTSTGGHFFTSSDAERDTVINNVTGSEFLASLSYEGEAFRAFSASGSDLVAVQRLFDPDSGSHALSTSETEIIGLQSSGFQLEGTAFWAYG